jgi:hypothetical protein
MSDFIDKLNRLSRGEHQPIGFGIRKTDLPASKIQLVAVLSPESDTGGADGADAVVLRISRAGSAAESLKTITDALPGIPAGVWLKGGKAGMKQLGKAGCDFLVFPAADTPLAAVESGEMSLIVEVEQALNDGLIRTINELPADAVLVDSEEKSSLTWRQRMVFQRFADLLTKPLLVLVPEKVTGGELVALWEAGVTAVVVEAGEAGQVKKLRQEIDKSDFPTQQRREKSEALLPPTGKETGRSMEEEDDED